jgi:hypothetical protein
MPWELQTSPLQADTKHGVVYDCKLESGTSFRGVTLQFQHSMCVQPQEEDCASVSKRSTCPQDAFIFYNDQVAEFLCHHGDRQPFESNGKEHESLRIE